MTGHSHCYSGAWQVQLRDKKELSVSLICWSGVHAPRLDIPTLGGCFALQSSELAGKTTMEHLGRLSGRKVTLLTVWCERLSWALVENTQESCLRSSVLSWDKFLRFWMLVTLFILIVIPVTVRTFVLGWVWWHTLAIPALREWDGKASLGYMGTTLS